MKLTTLLEAKMSPSTLIKQFEKIDGFIGFEIECLLSKKLVKGTTSEYNYDYGEEEDDFDGQSASHNSFDDMWYDNDDEESVQNDQEKYYPHLREILEDALDYISILKI